MLKKWLRLQQASSGTAVEGSPDALEQAFVDKHKLDVAEGTTATTGAHVFRARASAQRLRVINGIGGKDSRHEASLMMRLCA